MRGSEWVGFDDRRGVPAEISADEPSVSARIPRRIQIWDGRLRVAVEIRKSLCGGRKIENLIESACFQLKISRVRKLNGHHFREAGNEWINCGTIVG